MLQVLLAIYTSITGLSNVCTVHQTAVVVVSKRKINAKK